MSTSRWQVVLVFGVMISIGGGAQAATAVSLGCTTTGTATTPSCAVLADQLIVGSASQPGVIQGLASLVQGFYEGKITGRNQVSYHSVPVCSLKVGPIQKYLRQQLKLTSLETLEDLKNHRGQSCGDLHQFKVEQGTKGLKFELLFASKNPVQAPGQGPHYGYWEKSHLDSAYVLGLEEALLEVRKEVSSSSGTWKPRTVRAAAEWRRLATSKDRIGALRKVLYAEVDQRARTKTAKSGMFRASNREYHKIFDAAGASCAALVDSKLKRGQIKGASGVQQVVNKECMPKAKSVLQVYASKYFPLLFAQK